MDVGACREKPMASVPTRPGGNRASEQKLSIRADEAQKRMLRRAAERRRTSISQFVLETSLAEAERILEEPPIRLNSKEYAWFLAKLDEPPRDLLNLRRLLQEPTVWNG